MNGLSSNDDAVECPLCMEPLEVDDLTFFPCTCGYQVHTVIKAPLSAAYSSAIASRFADSVGIGSARMRTSCVRHAERSIPRIQLTLSRCRRRK